MVGRLFAWLYQPLHGIIKGEYSNCQGHTYNQVIPAAVGAGAMCYALQKPGLLPATRGAGQHRQLHQQPRSYQINGFHFLSFVSDFTFSTNSFTWSGVTFFALLPQLVFSWFIMAAISSGVRLLLVPTGGMGPYPSCIRPV